MALFDSVTSSSFQTIDGLYLEYVDGYISLRKAVQEYDKDAGQIIGQFNVVTQGTGSEDSRFLQ